MSMELTGELPRDFTNDMRTVGYELFYIYLIKPSLLNRGYT